MGRGILPRVVGRSAEEGFTVDLGLTFHSAGDFSLLDRNACPRGEGMMYAELPPWTLVLTNVTHVKKAMYKLVKRHRYDLACTYR